MENGVGSHASPPNGEVVNGKSWSRLFFIGKDGKERKVKDKDGKGKDSKGSKDKDGLNPSPKSASSTTLDSASVSALSAVSASVASLSLSASVSATDGEIPPSPKSSKSAFATIGSSKARSKSRFSYSSNRGQSSPSVPQTAASPSASPLIRDRANRLTGMSSSSASGTAASPSADDHSIANTQNTGIAQNISVQIGKHRAGESSTSVEDTNKATNNFQTLATRANNNEATLASLLPPDLISDGASENGSVRSSVQARVPSRQLLQAALDLAQRAVEMDKGNDVAGALAAYREAVTKLRVVMERVGVEPSGESKRAKNDDEGRTLRGIHDAYMARITLLSAYESNEENVNVDSEHEDTIPGLSSLNLDGTLANLTLDGDMSSSGAANAGASTSAFSINMSPPQSANGANGDSVLRSPDSAVGSSRRLRKLTGGKSLGLDEESSTFDTPAADADSSAPSTSAAAAAAGASDAGATDISSVNSVSAPTAVDPTSPRSSLQQEEDDRPLPPLPGPGESRPRKQSLTSSSQTLSATNNGTLNRRHKGGASMSSISEMNHDSPRDSVTDYDSASIKFRTMRSYASGSPDEYGRSSPSSLQAVFRQTLAPPVRLQGTAHLSPRPEPQPADIIHRPFHLLRILYASMDASGPGAYLTNVIHIDPAVWKPASWRSSGSSKSAKLTGQEAKIKCCDALVVHLEAVKRAGAPLLDGGREERFGADDASSRLSKSQMETVTRSAEEMLALLEALDDELDSTHKLLTSRGVAVGSGWKGKSRSSWGSRVAARVDKMAARNSPSDQNSVERYIDLLSQLFYLSDVLNEHLKNFTGDQSTKPYQSLNDKMYKAIESKLNRFAQFIGIILVPFVMDDFKVFMSGYLKGGLRYLEE